MNNHMARLKEELEMMSPSIPTITVSRRDLETLIRECEQMKGAMDDESIC